MWALMDNTVVPALMGNTLMQLGLLVAVLRATSAVGATLLIADARDVDELAPVAGVDPVVAMVNEVLRAQPSRVQRAMRQGTMSATLPWRRRARAMRVQRKRSWRAISRSMTPTQGPRLPELER